MFHDYHDAYNAAVDKARAYGRDVAIMRNAFGEWSIHFAMVQDADYAKYEIVTPNHPHTGTQSRPPKPDR